MSCLVTRFQTNSPLTTLTASQNLPVLGGQSGYAGLGQPCIHHKADRLKGLGTDCLPHGTILTEILNFQMEDYCAKLASAEQTIAGRNRAQLSHPPKELMGTFMALPLYRPYI